MSTEPAHKQEPSITAIFRGAFDAIRASPIILGLFLVSGVLRFILPPFVDSIVRLLLIIIGVVIAYQALGGQIRADSAFLLRLFMALIATLISYSLIIVGFFAFLLGVYGIIGLLVVGVPGIYVYARLFLSTPVVIVNGSGPFEALSESWRLMNESVFVTAGAVVIVFVGGILILIPPLLLIRSSVILNVGGTLVVDTLLAGMQAFLYLQLAEMP